MLNWDNDVLIFFDESSDATKIRRQVNSSTEYLTTQSLRRIFVDPVHKVKIRRPLVY
jgi:hypothetical protein